MVSWSAQVYVSANLLLSLALDNQAVLLSIGLTIFSPRSLGEQELSDPTFL